MKVGIFEPFGRIQSIQLMKDQETDRSKGYGFITYQEAEDAKKAMEHLNGFELAGKDMKVGHVTEQHQSTSLDQDEERARAALYGVQEPPTQRVNVAPKQQQESNLPPIATQCFMLSNMFDPITERDPHWDQETR